MRLKCEYETDSIPVGYHMMFVSLIKEAFRQADKEFKNKLYNYDDTRENKQAKDFTFGVYMKDFEKQEDIFEINDKVVLNLSTPDYELGIKFYNGLLKLEEFKYKDFFLNKLRINLTKEKEVDSERVKFTTLSPLCIKNKENYFLDIEDDSYEKELNYIADVVLENYRGYGLQDKLEFEPVDMSKVVVKQKIKEFTENTGRPYYYVNSYQGSFELKGVVEDLKDIYMLGIGFKRNQGFGMVEVI
ncbi:CRISPR-associated endoribonuclease Cas6 [Sporohalobacter salinus]|uniref:CRISPR-associated endoribonuclease Cas6 n=1 Tax=Sporohalobacter salinus TaxID=1494606 RepID=UPI00195F7133|nr:CRISPR-associated endoribonuclease Cas6 [Sporohalobacter salinus]MBM7623759.1 CRISPR-associated endoribonuclease Cas6 [Sporohalobacter salinus]